MVQMVINQSLSTDIRELTDKAKSQRARAINQEMKLPEYGKKIFATVSQELTRDYRKSFSEATLVWSIQFYKRFPKLEKVSTLSTRLKRDFYTDKCCLSLDDRKH